MSESQTRPCKTCGQPVMDNANGVIVHVGGGRTVQRCTYCPWMGSQAGGFTRCPGCGEEHALVKHHDAE